MESNSFISFLVNWLPLVVLIGGWIFVVHRYQGRSKSGKSLIEIQEAYLGELQKLNANLELITKDYGGRIERLEKALDTTSTR
jgi:ATP-dependent Zn protease